MRRPPPPLALAACLAPLCAVLCGAPAAHAGGLVWSLPEPGTEARYEGTFTQTLTDRNNQQTVVERRRNLTIRALDAETAEFRGERTPARWLEFVTVTGLSSEAGLDPGPAGRVLYKALVPESAVASDFADADGIPRAFLPVIRGWKQFGDEEAQPLGPALRVYPTLTLLTDYEPGEVQPAGEQTADTNVGSFDGTAYRSKAVEEAPRLRITNESEALVSPESPFGPVRWEATVVREIKDANQSREEYREVSRSVETMSLRGIDRGVRGELPLP